MSRLALAGTVSLVTLFLLAAPCATAARLDGAAPAPVAAAVGAGAWVPDRPTLHASSPRQHAPAASPANGTPGEEPAGEPGEGSGGSPAGDAGPTASPERASRQPVPQAATREPAPRGAPCAAGTADCDATARAPFLATLRKAEAADAAGDGAAMAVALGSLGATSMLAAGALLGGMLARRR